MVDLRQSIWLSSMVVYIGRQFRLQLYKNLKEQESQVYTFVRK